MKLQYYTPTIEELYIGFECEKQNQQLLANELQNQQELKLINGLDYEINADSLFAPHLIRAIDIQFYSLNPNTLYELRVKYLDREDIESFGWKLRTDDNRDLHIPEYKIQRFYLKTYSDNFCTIWDDSAVDQYCFRGTIKNKSELKKLMQQLNIEQNKTDSIAY